ncbi:MAG: hypothetical protein P8181_10480, partial [bacterium]
MTRVVSNRDENNSSRGVLRCELPEDSSVAGISFLFAENGVAPIPLTRDTRVAWNWKVSRVVDMNGFWLRIAGRQKRNGDTEHVAFVNWVNNLHDAFVYYDPPLVWRYHEVAPFEYFDDRFGPISDGDIVIDLITLILQGPGVEAWIDNIWLGEGPPPRDIDVSRTVEGAAIYVPTSLRSFSYGFIDGDLVPDRVDVYPN